MSIKLVHVTTPVSGTFYRAPSPEDPPYVKAGQQVKAGDIVCLVEQMKVFTEIMVEVDGIIREIMVNNEDPVGEGQVLMEVEVL